MTYNELRDKAYRFLAEVDREILEAEDKDLGRLMMRRAHLQMVINNCNRSTEKGYK
jgi:hypothetical protein